jgi:hypothetical protein
MSVISVPTTTITKLNTNLLTLYQANATLNNFPSNVVVSGSIFSTFNCIGNVFTAYIFLQSGSATSLANSGSVYYIDWSPNNIQWNGTTVVTGYTGSINLLNTWYAIQFTGSAPYFRVLLKNLTGSSISGSIVVMGR